MNEIHKQIRSIIWLENLGVQQKTAPSPQPMLSTIHTGIIQFHKVRSRRYKLVDKLVQLEWLTSRTNPIVELQTLSIFMYIYICYIIYNIKLYIYIYNPRSSLHVGKILSFLAKKKGPFKSLISKAQAGRVPTWRWLLGWRPWCEWRGTWSPNQRENHGRISGRINRIVNPNENSGCRIFNCHVWLFQGTILGVVKKKAPWRNESQDVLTNPIPHHDWCESRVSRGSHIRWKGFNEYGIMDEPTSNDLQPKGSKGSKGKTGLGDLPASTNIWSTRIDTSFSIQVRDMQFCIVLLTSPYPGETTSWNSCELSNVFCEKSPCWLNMLCVFFRYISNGETKPPSQTSIEKLVKNSHLQWILEQVHMPYALLVVSTAKDTEKGGGKKLVELCLDKF